MARNQLYQFANLSLDDLQKVNVVGTSGSGKTTVARRLADVLGHPHFELDGLFWQPDWQEATQEQFSEILDAIVCRPTWIIDGNYSRSEPVKWKHVQTVVWLDYSYVRTLSQAFGRAVNRIRTKQEIWPGTGNRETFRRTFLSRDSVLLWTMHSYWGVKQKYRRMMASSDLQHIKIIRLNNHRQVDEFLDTITALRQRQAESQISK